MKTLSILTSSCLALSSFAFTPSLQAASISFGSPAIAGSGCLGGTFSYQRSKLSNGQSISIRPSRFRANPGNKTCNLAMAVQVPKGYRVTSISGVYSGYAKGQAELRRSYFLAGDTGPSKVNKWISSNGRSFTQQDSTRLTAACGEDVNVRVNSRLSTLTNASSARISKMTITVRYARCTR